jgi:phosphatidylinositol glycan class M
MLYLFGWIIIKYYRNIRLTVFLMTYIFVSFNKVLTVQYYMWSFTALTLVINSSNYIQIKRWRGLLHMFAVWMLGVLTWMWVAEKIESKGQNMFM